MSEYNYITGKLSKEVVINGVTYKVGDTITIPIQFGLEEYFEDYEECNKEED